jgi:DNA repair exonuclease SbcCD ATPase subunit
VSAKKRVKTPGCICADSAKHEAAIVSLSRAVEELEARHEHARRERLDAESAGRYARAELADAQAQVEKSLLDAERYQQAGPSELCPTCQQPLRGEAHAAVHAQLLAVAAAASTRQEAAATADAACAKRAHECAVKLQSWQNDLDQARKLLKV